MQCPSCGFENMPGVEQCCVCSTGLGSKAVTESVMPPRRKDRSFIERLRWSIRESRVWAGARSGINAAGTPAHGASIPDWLGVREVVMIVLSVVPGLGHIFGNCDRRRGIQLLVATILAVGLGCLLIRTALSDILACAVVCLSAYSTAAIFDSVWTRKVSDQSRLLARLGISLMIISVYASGYMATRLVDNPVFTVVNVLAEDTNRYIAAGDTVLLRRADIFRRGDFIVGTSAAGSVLMAGPVIGVPGDTVTVSNHIYVNGAPTGVTSGLPISELFGTVQLTAGQYWVLPAYINHNADNPRQDLADAGVVMRDSIVGRGIAVTGPPNHRKWLHQPGE